MTADHQTVAVLGAGNMGTALAQVIASNGHEVRLWSIEHDVLEEIRDHQRNTKYLEGVRLHHGITAVWEMAEAVQGAGLVVVSVPSQVVGSLARDLGPLLAPDQLVLNVAKGLEGGTHRRMSEVLAAAAPAASAGRVGSMGGPAIAIEMARGLPMAIIIGIADEGACGQVQRILQNSHLKVETTTDVTGLELCATLKNVYAITLGICDGWGMGTNTKAFLGTVALQEMADIARTLGGRDETVFGLAGLGDLITTGFSAHSRNRTLGEKLGAAGDWQLFLRTNTVEGVAACRAISELVEGKGLRLHLLDTLHEILFDERPAAEAMRHFLDEFAYGAP
jgi:glycerol-3-phosphate dehydrogenase (NAD(P)+)